MLSHSQHRKSGKPKPINVVLRVYDISRGQAEKWSKFFLGTEITGIWHTGVCVFGFEYFYGGGIEKMPPDDVERYYEMHPVKEIRLGTTTKDIFAFEKFLWSVDSSFSRATYDLLKWNCNNFSDCVARFLLGRGIPQHILKLPESILETRMGPILVDMFKLTRGINPISSSTDDPRHPCHALSRPGRRQNGRARSRSTSVKERRSLSDRMNGFYSHSVAGGSNRVGNDSSTMEARSLEHFNSFSSDVSPLSSQNRRSTFNNHGSSAGINSFRSPGMWLSPARGETLQPSFATLNPVNNRDFPALPFFRTSGKASASQQRSSDNWPPGIRDASMPAGSQYSSSGSLQSMYAKMQNPQLPEVNGNSHQMNLGSYGDQKWPGHTSDEIGLSATYSSQHEKLVNSYIQHNSASYPLFSNNSASLVPSGITQDPPTQHSSGISDFTMGFHSTSSLPHLQPCFDRLSMDNMSPRVTRQKGNLMLSAQGVNNAFSVDYLERENPLMKPSLSDNSANRIPLRRNDEVAVSYNGTMDSHFYPRMGDALAQHKRQLPAEELAAPRRLGSLKEHATATSGSGPYPSTVTLSTRPASAQPTPVVYFPPGLSDSTNVLADWYPTPIQVQADAEQQRVNHLLSKTGKNVSVDTNFGNPASRTQPNHQLAADSSFFPSYPLYMGKGSELQSIDRRAAAKSIVQRSRARSLSVNDPVFLGRSLSRTGVKSHQNANFDHLDKMATLSTSAGATSVYSGGAFPSNALRAHASQRPRRLQESSGSTTQSDGYTAEAITDTESACSDTDASRDSGDGSLDTASTSEYDFNIPDLKTPSIGSSSTEHHNQIEPQPAFAAFGAENNNAAANTGRPLHSTVDRVKDRLSTMISDPEAAGDAPRMRKSESLSAISTRNRGYNKTTKVVAQNGDALSNTEALHRGMQNKGNSNPISNDAFLRKQRNVLILHWDNLHIVEKAGKRKLQTIKNSAPVDLTTSQSTKSTLHEPQIRSKRSARALEAVTRRDTADGSSNGLTATQPLMECRAVLLRHALSSKDTSHRVTTAKSGCVDVARERQEAAGPSQKQRTDLKQHMNGRAVDRDHAVDNHLFADALHRQKPTCESAVEEILLKGDSAQNVNEVQYSAAFSEDGVGSHRDTENLQQLHTPGGRACDENSSRRSKSKMKADRKGQQRAATRKTKQHRLVPLWSSRDGINHEDNVGIEDQAIVAFDDLGARRGTDDLRSERPAVRRSVPLTAVTPRVYGGRSSRHGGEPPREPLVKVNVAIARTEVLRAKRVSPCIAEVTDGEKHQTGSTTASTSLSAKSDYQQGNQVKGGVDASFDLGVDTHQQPLDAEDRIEHRSQDPMKHRALGADIQKRRTAVTSEMLGAGGSSSIAAEIRKNVKPQKLSQQRTDSRQVRLRHICALPDGSPPEEQIMTKPTPKLAYDSRGNKKKMQQRDYKFVPISFRIIDRLSDHTAV